MLYSEIRANTRIGIPIHRSRRPGKMKLSGFQVRARPPVRLRWRQVHQQTLRGNDFHVHRRACHHAAWRGHPPKLKHREQLLVQLRVPVVPRAAQRRFRLMRPGAAARMHPLRRDRAATARAELAFADLCRQRSSAALL